MQASVNTSAIDAADTTRIHHLDMARAVLMTLGVVLHSAQVYNPDNSWLVSSEATFGGSSLVVSAIRLFRMPAFFVVSGFFCALTIERYGADRFARVRLLRILVPLITSIVLLNSLQAWILVTTGFRDYDIAGYLAHTDFVSHLWFLINLVCYFLLAWLLARTSGPQLASLAHTTGRLLEGVSPIMLLLLLPTSVFAVYGLGSVGFPVHANLHPGVETFELFRHIPYFLFGALAYATTSARTRMLKFPVQISLSALIAALALPLVIKEIEDASGTLRVLTIYLHELAIWSAVFLCFSIFRRFFDRPSAVTQFFSEASYSIYLFHHCLVVIGAILLLNTALPPQVQFVVLICSVFALAVLIHALFILKVPTARLLFNGKR